MSTNNIALAHTQDQDKMQLGKGRSLSGVVVSNSREKTVKVNVVRKFKHPVYGKQIKRTKAYHVHTEDKIAIGTEVDILECRPISKTKTWVIKTSK